MRYTKKASIALTLGFALSLPQVAFAQAIDCNTMSHPSCQAPSTIAPEPPKPAAVVAPEMVAAPSVDQVPTAATQKKRKNPSIDSQIRRVTRQLNQIDQQKRKNRERIAKHEEKIRVLTAKIAEIKKRIASLNGGQEPKPGQTNDSHGDTQIALEAAQAEIARLNQELENLRTVQVSENTPADPLAFPPSEEIQTQESRESAPSVPTPAPSIVPATEPTSALPSKSTTAERSAIVARFSPKARANTSAPRGPAKRVESSQLPSGADMTLDALKTSLRGFHWEASRDGRSVSFDGKIFVACETSFEKLKIAQVRSADGYRVGIRVRDAGQEFTKCMEAFKDKICDATDEIDDACVAVSKNTVKDPASSPALALAGIDLPQNPVKAIEIGVFVAKPDTQPTSDNVEFTTEFKGLEQNGRSTYISAQTQQRLDREAADKKEQDQYEGQIKAIEDLTCTVSDCFQKGDFETARDVCSELGRLRSQGGLDGDLYALASKHFMSCTSEIDNRDKEEKVKVLLGEFDDATDPAVALKKANALVAIANSKKEYAAMIAEKFLGKIQSLSQGSTNTLSLPALPGLTQPTQAGVPSLGQPGLNAAAMQARREADASAKTFAAAKELAKLGMKLKAGKDWDELFSQQLAAVDFQSCEARASLMGIMDAKVQKCINDNYQTAQVMYKKDCGKDQSSDACMNAVMMYQTVQSTYGNGVQKAQQLMAAQQQQAMPNMNNLMGNGNSFMGLNNYGNANTLNLPGQLSPINPAPNTMSGLMNLGNRNPGMNTVAGSSPMLSGVQFF